MATVDLYFLSEATVVRITREMNFERIPVAGEFLRIDAGGLLPQIVTEVVHDVDGSCRVVLGVPKNSDDNIDFWEEAELDEDISELQKAGWAIASKKPNTAWKNAS
ncbi:hypothetical protein [uncultured Tateyamaria sp.]|uniref:hypothetical protein n=1 Tax=uncultured Tateyamaria sp. TaxID=455651 RepID=UPI0026374E57|nr:hypothetical protein [uncultured Tateyamaria sp.]